MDFSPNKDEITVSVIIPAFNAEKYIHETITSVLNQTFTNFEIIVVDDGSTDNTASIVESFGKKVKLYKRLNQGVSSARNYAVSKSKNNWLAFIDADDLWTDDKLNIQISSLNGASWSHTNSIYIGENQNGKISRSDLTPQYGGQVFEHLILNNFITTSTVMIKKDIFLNHHGFDETMIALEDWKLWLKIAEKETISYVEEPLAYYRVYSGSTSRRARIILPIHIDLINSIFSDNEINQKYLSMKRKAISNSYSICSYIAEDSKDFRHSFFYALSSLYFDALNPNKVKRLLRTVISLIRTP